MAFTRPVVNENLYCTKYQILDKSGNVTEGNAADIMISS